jgi:hypothetical protein
VLHSWVRKLGKVVGYDSVGRSSTWKESGKVIRLGMNI